MDEKALKILLDSYWSSTGWKKSRPDVTNVDFQYALKAGFMFKPVYMSHDEAIIELKNYTSSLNRIDISNAFLSSLSTRKLELRSALGSYACALSMPPHRFNRKSDTLKYCATCGMFGEERKEIDLNVLNFERYKWGGVRHSDPLYALFDLEQFSKLSKIEPTNEDLKIFNQIIELILSLPESAKPRDLEKFLGTVFKSNKSEREILIGILGYCGILETKSQKGYFENYPSYTNRELPPVNKIDWNYPVCWWQGKDRVNNDAISFFFPQLKA